MVIERLEQQLEEARINAEEQQAVIAGFRWEVEEQEIERQDVIRQRDDAERRAAAALDALQAATAQSLSNNPAQSSSDKLVLDPVEEAQLEELQIEEHQKPGSSAGQSSLAASTPIDPSSRSLPPAMRSMPPATRKQALAVIAQGADHQKLAASEAWRIVEEQLERFGGPTGWSWSSDGRGAATDAGSAHYIRFGGAQVEALLCDYDLVDARYLVALGEANGVVPPWRDVPDCARINQQTAWRLRAWNQPFSLPVLVLSYPWLDKVRSICAYLPASESATADSLPLLLFRCTPRSPSLKEHPDKAGETLRRILPILRAMVAEAQRHATYATVGVMWDFMSCPQGERTPEEQKRFERCLKRINHWYALPFTIVLAVTTELPCGVEHMNKNPYSARGWCFFEKHMASLVKDDGCFWDLALHHEGEQIDFDRCQMTLKFSRLPPTSPPTVEKQLREGVASGSLVFTNDSDLDRVVERYAQGFVEAFDALEDGNKIIHYQKLGWGDDEVETLLATLAYMGSHCAKE